MVSQMKRTDLESIHLGLLKLIFTYLDNYQIKDISALRDLIYLRTLM